jgi:hypothetical protein
MKICSAPCSGALLAVLFAGTGCPAAMATEASGTSEIEILQNQIGELRRDYEARISALESRLAALLDAPPAETAPPAVRTAAPVRAPDVAATTVPRSVGNTAAFNPAIGVIFQGQAWQSRLDEEEQSIPGFPRGGEAGPIVDGLAIAETEINASANVDDLFTAWLTVPVVIEDGETAVEIEEAWIETLRMPAGLSARFGRFYSGIGYLNGKHSHTWDFADQPLAYQAFLGNQYLDDGLQLRWLAPTDIYTEIGAEVLRGDRYPAGGAARGGLGAHSLFARVGGDAGASSSWQAGLSWLHAKARDRASGGEDEPLLFSGESDLIVAEFIWKWAPSGNWKQRNLVLQSEFIWRNEDGTYRLPDGTLPAIDRDQTGWYAQAVYQPRPQWRLGARYDQLSSDDAGPAFDGTALDAQSRDPRRYTIMVDWSHSEYSRLRLQYAHDKSGERNNDQWGLQYIMSIGAHGAHAF